MFKDMNEDALAPFVLLLLLVYLWGNLRMRQYETTRLQDRRLLAVKSEKVSREGRKWWEKTLSWCIWGSGLWRRCIQSIYDVVPWLDLMSPINVHQAADAPPLDVEGLEALDPAALVKQDLKLKKVFISLFYFFSLFFFSFFCRIGYSVLTIC